MVTTFAPPQVLENPVDAAANDQRHRYNLTEFGQEDGKNRVKHFLDEIVLHEQKIGNDVVLCDGKVVFVPSGGNKEA